MPLWPTGNTCLMNVPDFTYLLQQRDANVSAEQTRELEEILKEYPYFQAARALYLKGLKTQNSFKYNNALKVTAAYTADREILFDYITSDTFLQHAIADTISGKNPLRDHEIVSEEVESDPDAAADLIEASEDEPLPRSAKDADAILDPALFRSKDPEVDKKLREDKEEAARRLDMGAPLEFTRREKYSFGEWLQLTSLKTVKKEEEDQSETKSPQPARKRKFELIDRFIEENPKIIPREDLGRKVDIKTSVKLDKEELMTETLARVYLEQKKYKKALQAYKILSLKYPEKSGFFADRIKAVKKLQSEK